MRRILNFTDEDVAKGKELVGEFYDKTNHIFYDLPPKELNDMMEDMDDGESEEFMGEVMGKMFGKGDGLGQGCNVDGAGELSPEAEAERYRKIVDMIKNGTYDDHLRGDGVNEADAKAHLKNIVEQVKDHKRARGLDPYGSNALVEGLFLPSIIPWDRELQDVIGNITIPYRKSIRAMSRRTPKNVWSHGRVLDRVARIWVVFDSSGSTMGDRILFLSEVVGLMDDFEKWEIYIFEVDAAIQRVYRLDPSNDDFGLDRNMKGNGGTAFTPIFTYLTDSEYREAINEQLALNDDDIPDHDDPVVIYFTDGYGESELMVDDLEFYLENPPIFVTSTDTVSISEGKYKEFIRVIKAPELFENSKNK